MMLNARRLCGCVFYKYEHKLLIFFIDFQVICIETVFSSRNTVHSINFLKAVS